MVPNMATFRSIVCPVDFSEHSVQALRLAVGLAGRDGARLTVLTVNEPFLVEAAAAAQYGSDYVAHEAAKEMRAVFESLIPSVKSWAPPPHVVVRTGTIDREILECAAGENADLIVMGTHGLGGYRKMFFGSVTERVLRGSSIPVLAVPLTERRIVVFSERVPLFNVPGILVPVDLSPSSDRQIRLAAELARGFGTSLLAVHVVAEVRAYAGVHDAVKAHERTRLRQARERLARLADAASGGVLVETRVTYGHPADEIARVAIEQEIGLIVMGLTGDGASGSCPGSVAYRVLTMAPAPVFALPLQEGVSGREELSRAKEGLPNLLRVEAAPCGPDSAHFIRGREIEDATVCQAER